MMKLRMSRTDRMVGHNDGTIEVAYISLLKSNNTWTNSVREQQRGPSL